MLSSVYIKNSPMFPANDFRKTTNFHELFIYTVF